MGRRRPAYPLDPLLVTPISVIMPESTRIEGRGMIPQAMAKTEQLATMATAGGGLTILASFNEWTGEYAPLITFVFGLVAMLTGIGTLAYKIWNGRSLRDQRKKDRSLAHKQMDHDRFMKGVRDDDRH